jgi:uncharacterized protein with PIN domain
LGGLAKWLRLLGFDTVCENEVPPGDFRECLKGGHIFLSRTRERFQQADASNRLFVRADKPLDQLRQVVADLRIRREETLPFSRCVHCNRRVERVDKAAVLGRVPDHVFATHRRFRRCPECGRIFWAGSHVSRSGEIFASLFNDR